MPSAAAAIKSAVDVAVMLDVLGNNVRDTSLLEMVQPWQDWTSSGGVAHA
jgi:hypothetical protein